jgi:hypothetical protein
MFVVAILALVMTRIGLVLAFVKRPYAK